ncbi:E3 ubiquitin-protein ligase RNF25 [Fasciola gigantica]|uniref:E3 ubiquitin-protein ligase RNF25 n=1 Tax=Fasciola gigantica TaxID=46835 RepID=A0A504YXR9_FASGI|nr:E3 ubiquitin-protein ligase RNF25 [Fasciola gigantica]
MSSRLEDELLLLSEIFPEYCTTTEIDGYRQITVVVKPGIGFSTSCPGLVDLKVRIRCGSKYPEEPPEISLKNIHGLSVGDQNKLRNLLEELVQCRKSEPVLFDIVDFCREFISKNVPSIECAICLTGFTDESQVYVTSEYHYFHKVCIGEYMAQREVDFHRELEELLSKDPYYQSPGLRVRAFFVSP